MTTAPFEEKAAVVVTRISKSPTVPTTLSFNSMKRSSPNTTAGEIEIENDNDNLVLQRRYVDSEKNAITSPSTPSLRSNDPRFILPKCELPPRKELEKVEVFVAKALKEQHQSPEFAPPVQAYRGILEALRYRKDLPLLRQILIALRTSALSYLTSDSKKHAQLIHILVRFVPFPPESAILRSIGDMEQTNDFETMDFTIADAHLHFLTAFVSANSLFVIPAVSALWKMLTFSITDAHPERTHRIHAALATILRLCPSARDHIFPSMAKGNPFRYRCVEEMNWYYKQCLYVLEYLPIIRGQVLKLIIDRCLELDVEIKISDIGEATLDSSSECDENNHAETSKSFEVDDERKIVSTEMAESSVNSMAEKLDALMLLLFQHLQYTFSEGEVTADTLFQILLHVFEASIIVTYKSKFVQFVMMLVCGLDANARLSNNSTINLEDVLYRDFAAKLIDIIIDPNRSTVTRQTGACYLASFISRVNFVCAETVSEAVDALLRWAEAYIAAVSVELSIHAVDARDQSRQHAMFYTVCQSAFYIMCFRGAEAVQFCQSNNSVKQLIIHVDLGSNRWNHVCSHPLLPLRYCLESVRLEFLRIARMFSLLSDDVLNRLLEDDRQQSGSGHLRKKMRVSLISTPVTIEKERIRGGVGGLGRGPNPLDSFFPFDPYLLRQSHSFVEPFYVHWEGGAPDQVVVVEGEQSSPCTDEEKSDVDVEDEYSDDESTKEESNHESDDGNASDSDSECEASETNIRRNRLMSFASNTTSVSELAGSVDERSVSQNVSRLEQQYLGFPNSRKRERLPSIESNGSW